MAKKLLAQEAKSMQLKYGALKMKGEKANQGKKKDHNMTGK